jgi:DHA1 family multidrug resistance protein-like MFS transporter/DHA1 family quinolone resistance protein-like MFS transporter
VNNDASLNKTTLPLKNIVLLPCAVLAAVGISMMTFSLLFYVRDVFDAPPGIVSIFAAMFTFSYSVSCFAMRPVFNRLLPRYAIILSVVLMALWVFCILMTTVLSAAFVFIVLVGISNSFFWPPLMGWFSAGLERRTLSRSLSYFNVSWSSGMILGPFLGGILFEIQPSLPVFVSIACLLLIAAYTAAASALLPGIRSDRYREAEPRKKGTGSVRDESTFLRFPSWFVLFFVYLVFGVLQNVFPLFARGGLGFSESSIGLLLLFRGLFIVIGFWLLGRTGFWHFKWWWIGGGLLALTLSVASFFTASSFFSYIVLFAAFGLIMSVIYNNSVFHGVSGSTERARRMAVHEALLAGGSVVGSMAGGLIYQNSGFPTVLYFCLIAVASAALPVSFLLLRRSHE